MGVYAGSCWVAAVVPARCAVAGDAVEVVPLAAETAAVAGVEEPDVGLELVGLAVMLLNV
jgi:hypothetical protein